MGALFWLFFFFFSAQVQSLAKGVVAWHLCKNLGSWEGRHMRAWPSAAAPGLITVLCPIVSALCFTGDEYEKGRSASNVWPIMSLRALFVFLHLCACWSFLSCFLRIVMKSREHGGITDVKENKVYGIRGKPSKWCIWDAMCEMCQHTKDIKDKATHKTNKRTKQTQKQHTRRTKPSKTTKQQKKPQQNQTTRGKTETRPLT